MHDAPLQPERSQKIAQVPEDVLYWRGFGVGAHEDQAR
jgi:hypothetical protein